MWNPSRKENAGIELRNLKLSSGSWEYSELLRDALVAKDWNIDPAEFWARSKMARAVMIAVTEVSNEMQSYEQKVTLKT